jgi:hypothetical protein
VWSRFQCWWFVASLVACSPRNAALVPDGSAHALDGDGVLKLFADAPGTAFRLGHENPNQLGGLVIEKGIRAEPGIANGVQFWSVRAYALDYSSGGNGKTARMHIRASGAAQRFTWQNQHGYLSSEADLRNQEFTAYVRVLGIFDLRRAAVTLKIRGGEHTKNAPERASCTMLTFAPKGGRGVSRFGKELNHPDYDYVPLRLRHDAALEEGRWVGLKLVSFDEPGNPDRVVNRLYVDDEPFLPDGTPRNRFALLSEYVDRAGEDTGLYDTLVNWGGFQTTLRVDGVDQVDVAILSVREIDPNAPCCGERR